MKKFKFLNLVIILVITFSYQGCRKQIIATEQEMATYGWSLFEEGSYLESADWFYSSIQEDSLYKDGYNGLGWSLGKLMLPDSGIQYLLSGTPLEKDRSNINDVAKEIQAGLCFSYNAIGNDTSAITYGSLLIDAIDKDAVPDWHFTHDTTLNHLDVRLVLAVANYSLGNFSESLSQVQDIIGFIDSATAFEADTTTAGQQALAEEIEILQQLLQ